MRARRRSAPRARASATRAARVPLFSRHDALAAERRDLSQRRALAVALPAALALVGLLAAGAAVPGGPLAALVAAIALPFVLDRVLRLAWPAYRGWARRSAEIARALRLARERVGEVFARYRERQRGETFKRAYDLAGRDTRALEEALAVGMHREGREVFVTAFMREGRALRVTASIGSPFRCRAADDPSRWAEHVERLGADEVRQYHNHPEHGGHTEPSRADLRANTALRGLMGAHGDKLRSYVLCWNRIGEWRVFEYAPRRPLRLESAFDALGEDARPE